jgi:hypothetical protein
MVLIILICLALIALVGGMILLSKTKKDNLGGFFKFVSWFVIVMSFAVILFSVGTGMCRGFRHACGKGCMKERGCMYGPQGMMKCGPDGRVCMIPCCEKEMRKCCMNKENEMGCKGEGKEMIGCGKYMNKMCAGKGMENMTPEQKAENKVKMLTEKLKLTSAQIPKVKEAFLKCFQTCEMNMKAAGGDKEKCEMLCKKCKSDKMDALTKVLTPEQMKNLPPCCQ